MAMLLCRDHWSRLPFDIQNAITSAWREIRMDDWRDAGRRAVSWLDANPARITPAPRWSGLDLSHPERSDMTQRVTTEA
jgi:hypothetical protein